MNDDRGSVNSYFLSDLLLHIFISYVYASDISTIYIEYNLPENNIKYN